MRESDDVLTTMAVLLSDVWADYDYSISKTQTHTMWQCMHKAQSGVERTATIQLCTDTDNLDMTAIGKQLKGSAE